MKISNEIFQHIYKTFQSDGDLFYEEEAVCLFAFRILPNLCQQIITRIINVDENISFKDIKWTDIFQDIKELKHYTRILYQIKILTQTDIITLNPNFKKNMKKIFSEGLTPLTMEFKTKRKDYESCMKTGIKSLQKYLKNLFSLDSYAIQDTENDHLQFLQNIKFIRKESPNYKLTQNAIIFLLSPKQLQIRTIMIKYISNHQNKIRSNSTSGNSSFGNNNQYEIRVEETNFINQLFKICNLEIGAVFYELPTGYPREFYDHLKYLRNFGIIRAKKDHRQKTKYYVTPLIKCLFENMNHEIDQYENSQFLIVETNFKIYAYTKNEFEIKVLEFLFEIEYTFPEFIVGYITRSSIRKALKKGASSNVILEYISMHAHPKVDCSCVINDIKYYVPENVAHQIVIWEEEKNAIVSNNVLHLYEFADGNQFDRYLDQINQFRIPILWQSRDKSTIIVPRSYEANIRRLEQ